MKPAIFIIGGSPLQQPLLLTASAEYTTYVIDGNPNCFLSTQCDFFIYHDFSDIDGLLQYAEKIKPVLTLTIAGELANYAAAVVSNYLNTPYNSVECVYNTLNKIQMKRCFVKNNIPSPKLLFICSEKNSEINYVDIKFPCVIKPAQSSAGRGVRLVYNAKELKQLLPQVIQTSNDKQAMIEEFEEGVQYSVETISSDSKHQIIGITREFFGDHPYFVEIEQLFPVSLNHELTMKIEELIIQTLNALNVQVGACHIELRITPDEQITIIEVASRMGGWRSELISIAYSIDYSKLLINAHNHNLEKICFPDKHYFAMVKMLFNEDNQTRYNDLSKNKNFEVSPITWLKPLTSNAKTSLIDSSGYYFIKIDKFENIQDVIG